MGRGDSAAGVATEKVRTPLGRRCGQEAGTASWLFLVVGRGFWLLLGGEIEKKILNGGIRMQICVCNTLFPFSTAFSSFTVKTWGGKPKIGFSQRNINLTESTCLPGTEVNVSIFLYVLVLMKNTPNFISPGTIPDRTAEYMSTSNHPSVIGGLCSFHISKLRQNPCLPFLSLAVTLHNLSML